MVRFFEEGELEVGDLVPIEVAEEAGLSTTPNKVTNETRSSITPGKSKKRAASSTLCSC